MRRLSDSMVAGNGICVGFKDSTVYLSGPGVSQKRLVVV